MEYSKKHIFVQEATASYAINFSTSIDVVVSILAWGFHFPISTYLPAVYQALKPGGILIVDIRKGTNGLEELATKFNSTHIITSAARYDRVLATK